MNLFTRKMHLFCVSNIMVSFVCTGLVGINGYTTTNETVENAHEISLIASDTEPVSQKGEGEENLVSFVNSSIKIIVDKQKEALDEKKTVNNIIAKADVVTSNTKKTTKSTTTNKKTTNVVTKKEVKNAVSYQPASYSSVTGEAIVNYAKKYMGLRYKSGTPSLTNGADCSGFTMLIFREFGVSLPRTVGGQIGRGTYVNKSDLQKGDLVFYKAKGSKGGASHVGIYIGSGQVIHESRPGVGVKISSVNMMQYVTARRVINSTAKKIAEQKLEEEKKNETITDVTSNNEATTNNENAVSPEQVENNNVITSNDVVNNNTTTDNNIVVTSNENTSNNEAQNTTNTTITEANEPKESNETINGSNLSE